MNSTTVILKRILVLLFVLQLLRQGLLEKSSKDQKEQDYDSVANSDEANDYGDRGSIHVFHDVGADRIRPAEGNCNLIPSPRIPPRREYRQRGQDEREETDWESLAQKEHIFNSRGDSKYNKVAAVGDRDKVAAFANGPWARHAQGKKPSAKAATEQVKGQGRAGKGWNGWGFWG